MKQKTLAFRTINFRQVFQLDQIIAAKLHAVFGDAAYKTNEKGSSTEKNP